MGLSNCHGLRHAYAQRRYHEITKSYDQSGNGLICPIQGGRVSKELNPLENIGTEPQEKLLASRLGIRD